MIVLEREEVVVRCTRWLVEVALNVDRVLRARSEHQQLDLVGRCKTKIQIGPEHAVMVAVSFAHRGHSPGRVATPEIVFVAEDG